MATFKLNNNDMKCIRCKNFYETYNHIIMEGKTAYPLCDLTNVYVSMN